MKTLRYVLFAGILFCGFAFTSVNAANYFEIQANSNWGSDVNLRTAVKTNGHHLSIVRWTKSNKSSHKMIFRVRDVSSGKTYGQGTISYLDYDTFETKISNGTETYLQARREHIIDPYTTVSGDWLP